MKRYLITGLAVVAVVLVAAVAALYVFGKPTTTREVAVSAASPDAGPQAAAAGEPKPEAASKPATGSVPAPDPSTPLAIEIPGCVCHSKDPKLVKEHEAYRMNQCAGCHAGGVPTGR